MIPCKPLFEFRRIISAVPCALLATLLVVGHVALAAKKPHLQEDVYAPLAKAPKKVMDRRNPLAADPDAVRAGAKLFATHCAECHGDMAEGGKKAPSLLAPQVQNSSDGALFWLLTNGVVRRGMPVWSRLPDAQRWQLVSYIKGLGPLPEQPKPALSDAQPMHP